MFKSEHRRLKHDAILYDDEATLASAAVSFVRRGVEREEVVMVDTGVLPVASLLRALFEGEKQVVFTDRPAGSTPATVLDGYRRTMERGLASGARGYRVIGYVDLHRSKLPWQEWLRYEATVNRVFHCYPLRTLCPYDLTTISAEMADALMRAHTGLVEARGWRENGDYVEPEKLVVADGLVTPPLAVQESPLRMVLEVSDDPRGLRLEIYAATMFTSLSQLQIEDFVKAVDEAVTNAHKHVGPPVLVRLWACDRGVVCTVTDQGPGVEDPMAGCARPRRPSEGLGLWACRQLVDIVDYERGEDGFTVRLASLA